MTETARPMRADAARNRAKVLEVAYETFAAEGVAVPIDEIARRAGVGAGTVYRHFPTKEALFQAVFEDRVRHIVDDGRALVASEGPGEALYAFMRDILQTGTADHGLFDALARGPGFCGGRRDGRREGISRRARRAVGRRPGGGHGAGRRRRAGGQGAADGLQVQLRVRQRDAERVVDVIIDGLRA